MLENVRTTPCRFCGEPVVLTITRNRNTLPVSASTFVLVKEDAFTGRPVFDGRWHRLHFETCLGKDGRVQSGGASHGHR